jgi:uncharacterized protein (DUF4415 family)
MSDHYDFSKAKRGAVVSAGRKERITIRLDPEVITWFKEQVHLAGGGNYQSLINQALQHFIAEQQSDEKFEDTLRRVIREELKRQV